MRIGFLSSDWSDLVQSHPGGCTWIRAMSVSAAANQIEGYEAFVGDYGWNEEQGFVVVPTIERAKYGGGGWGILENYDSCHDNIDVVIMKLWMWHEYEYYIKRAQEFRTNNYY
jgi:hypothetical protein